MKKTDKLAYIFLVIGIGFFQNIFGNFVNKAIEPSSENTYFISGLSDQPGMASKNLDIIHKAAIKCKGSKIHKIVFPSGIFEIGNDQTLEDMDSLMTGKLSPRTIFKENYAPFNVSMCFSGANDLIVDGQGCTLKYCGLIQPFEVRNCNNITFKNLIIEWKRPLFSEGIVKFVKGEEVEVEVFPEFPVHGGEPVISFQNVDIATGHLSGVCQFSDISPLRLVGPQTVRFKASDIKFVNAGDIMIMRHIYNYRPGFNLFNCSDVIIEDVTIHSLPGMGVYGTRTHNITLKRYKVYPSGTRTMSDNVDASHFISCTGTITIDSCYFEGMGDDATNVHSFYYTIGERINNNTVRAFIAHSYSPGEKLRDYPDVGDEIEFVRKNTLLPYSNAKITAVDFHEDVNETTIQFDRALPAGFSPDDLIANISKHAKLVFTNNIVRNIRGRGILVQTRGAVIKNNRFEFCTGQGIHVDTAYPWMESVGTRNVIISQNIFHGCGYGNTIYCDAIGITVETECNDQAIGVHKDLTIEDNLVIGHTKPAFFLSALERAFIKGNRIISNGPAVRLEYAADVEFEHNNFDKSSVIIGNGCEGRAIKSFSK